MREVLHVMAGEISRGLVGEMGGPRSELRFASESIVDLLLQQLAGEVVRQLRHANGGDASTEQDLEQRVQKIERRLERLAIAEEQGEDTEVISAKTSLPNLKYARPKYKSLESVLKYVEGDDDNKGLLKLVIMNFND